MDKETIDLDDDEDFDIDELLSEEEDNPVEKVTEESPSSSTVKEEKRGKGRPKGTTKKKETPEVPIEMAEADKDLSNMEWQPYTYPAFNGLQNIKTGEAIDEAEAIRRILNYSQEAARNSR